MLETAHRSTLSQYELSFCHTDSLSILKNPLLRQHHRLPHFRPAIAYRPACSSFRAVSIASAIDDGAGRQTWIYHFSICVLSSQKCKVHSERVSITTITTQVDRTWYPQDYYRRLLTVLYLYLETRKIFTTQSLGVSRHLFISYDYSLS